MSMPPDDPSTTEPPRGDSVSCAELPEHYSDLLALEHAIAVGEDLSADPTPASGDDRSSSSIHLASVHIADCETCQTDFADFVGSTRRVQAWDMPEPSPALIEGILGAVDSSATSIIDPRDLPRQRIHPSGLRRVASHVFAAVAGAAAVFVLTTQGAHNPMDVPGNGSSGLTAKGPSSSSGVSASNGPAVDSEVDGGGQPHGNAPSVGGPTSTLLAGTQTPTSDARQEGIRVRFASGGGEIVRDGQRERVAGTVTFYPGENIEIAPRDPVIVEKIVPERAVIHQRAPWMVLPPIEDVDVDEYALAFNDKLDTLRQSFGKVSQTWDDVAVPALSGAWREELRQQLERHKAVAAADLPKMPVTPVPRPPAGPSSLTNSANNAHKATMVSVEVNRPSPVEVTTSGKGLRIKTRGALSEVVPRLLVLLRSNHPEVRRLVADRLQLIRNDLEQDETLRAAFVASDETLKNRAADSSLLGRFLPRSRSESTEPGVVERWSHWWESNAIHLVARGANGTF